MQRQLSQQLRRLIAQRWRRHAIDTLLTATSLGFIAVFLGVVLAIIGIVSLPHPLLGWVLAGSVVTGAVRALVFRLTPSTAARRLDRRFRLSEQLSTALEVGDDQAGVASRLQQQAQETIRRINYYVNKKQRPAWPDALMLGAFLLMLAGLLLLIESPMAPVGVAQPLPALNRPDQVADTLSTEASSSTEMGTTPGSGVDPGVLSALADALRDQSLTRPVAEALDQGDIAGAAEMLRELADQMGEVSPEAREAIADALRDAARQIDPARPDLADQMRATADALQFGDAIASAAGVEALADALERQPSAPIAGGSGGGAGNAPGSQRREQSFNPLGIEGRPLELATRGTGQLPAPGTASDVTGSTQSGGLSMRSSGVSLSGPVQAADDPLRVPMDVRDVVRDYFSP
ncbi:hypothetical protein [Chloroflexus sp.]|uniref:hypothetical protein n=1 Tax=Chloroflexus sp. TaxID=1904827 RepID=UPI00260DA5C4|nr:hypothetical protein [uncultured Chloroflexus sp.]